MEEKSWLDEAFENPDVTDETPSDGFRFPSSIFFLDLEGVKGMGPPVVLKNEIKEEDGTTSRSFTVLNGNGSRKKFKSSDETDDTDDIDDWLHDQSDPIHIMAIPDKGMEHVTVQSIHHIHKGYIIKGSDGSLYISCTIAKIVNGMMKQVFLLNKKLSLPKKGRIITDLFTAVLSGRIGSRGQSMLALRRTFASYGNLGESYGKAFSVLDSKGSIWTFYTESTFLHDTFDVDDVGAEIKRAYKQLPLLGNLVKLPKLEYKGIRLKNVHATHCGTRSYYQDLDVVYAITEGGHIIGYGIGSTLDANRDRNKKALPALLWNSKNNPSDSKFVKIFALPDGLLVVDERGSLFAFDHNGIDESSTAAKLGTPRPIQLWNYRADSPIDWGEKRVLELHMADCIENAAFIIHMDDGTFWMSHMSLETFGKRLNENRRLAIFDNVNYFKLLAITKGMALFAVPAARGYGDSEKLEIMGFKISDVGNYWNELFIIDADVEENPATVSFGDEYLPFITRRKRSRNVGPASPASKRRLQPVECDFCDRNTSKITCANCRKAHYCLPFCQKMHWRHRNGHHKDC